MKEHERVHRMSRVRRFDRVGITVADLDTVSAFFVELGFELEGRTYLEGEFLFAATSSTVAVIEGTLPAKPSSACSGRRLGFPLSVETSPSWRWAMVKARRKFDEDFKQRAVRLVRETGEPIAQVARELGVNEGTLGNWCAQERRRHGEGAVTESERDELRRLRKENAELRMRCDVLKRSAALWVEDAMRR
jgi:transposase